MSKNLISSKKLENMRKGKFTSNKEEIETCAICKRMLFIVKFFDVDIEKWICFNCLNKKMEVKNV